MNQVVVRPASSAPALALRRGTWRKLICGASNQDLAAVTDLSWAYTKAGIHCIDVAADPAVAAAARVGINAALDPGQQAPWLMVSLNDARDPHFRKASFDARRCPPHCPRPCEARCPVGAISAEGVAAARCYGCGRCLDACPLGLISEQSWCLEPSRLLPVLSSSQPDAIEIHTRPGSFAPFARLLERLAPLLARLRLLAVSAGGGTADLPSYLWQLLPLLEAQPAPFLWQLDGRPMSGDMGRGTAHAAVALALAVRRTGLPGPLQVAGGTNAYTQPLLRRHGLGGNGTAPPAVAGIAFGGAARQLLAPLIQDARTRGSTLRHQPDLATTAVNRARQLLG